MTALFTTIGEILVDFTPLVRGEEVVGFQMHPGGSPYNVAVGLARLGAQVEFAGKVSTDFFGRFLRNHLAREGVGTRWLSRSPAPTTLAFVTTERGEPAFSFYGRGTADTLLQAEDLSDLQSADVLHFGSISLLQPPASDAILGLVERLRGRALLSFDPNIRPGLVDEPATYRRLLERALRLADIVKLSRADAAWLMPAHPLEVARKALLEFGPALVIVTRGAEGCDAGSATHSLQQPALPVPVTDTVGAGDAFTAGLLFRLAERGILTRSGLERLTADGLDDVLRFATVAAALICTRAGADPPRREEIASRLASPWLARRG